MPTPHTAPRCVYAPVDNGLGDHWAAVNWCLRQSIASAQDVFLSDRPVMQWHPEKFRPGRLCSILHLLSHPAASVHLVDEGATNHIDPERIWQLPYLPTQQRWKPNLNDYICYQSDPVTLHRNDLTAAEEKAFVNTLQRRGSTAVKLGSHLPLEECVDILSRCAALVCTSSGFAHVAHSVGAPLFLVKGTADLGYLIKHHVGKAYVLCETYLHSLDLMRIEQACLAG